MYDGTMLEGFRVLAAHNREMDERLLALLDGPPPIALDLDTGAYFGSVAGTLNHVLFGDHFILTRVKHLLGQPSALDVVSDQWEFEPKRVYASTLPDFHAAFTGIDGAIVDFLAEATNEMLGRSIEMGDRRVPMWPFLQHLFQHQTHHRGQVTTLLSQAGIDHGGFSRFIDVYLAQPSA